MYFFSLFIIFQPGLPAPPPALISDLVSTERSEDLFALKEFINLSSCPELERKSLYF